MPGRCRWHFIGHLQSNKVRDAVELFEMIQGVDSLRCAGNFQALRTGGEADAHFAGDERGGEASKFGYKPEQLWRN